jgi:DNA sulfur modification protein DndC
VVHLIETQQIPRPTTLTVLYADTRQEIPPLHFGAMQMLETLRQKGYGARVVLPKLDDRYFVYMLGRGVPPPNNNTLRWCTPQIKVEPMTDALRGLRDEYGEKFLMLTGVRVGESAQRDSGSRCRVARTARNAARAGFRRPRRRPWLIRLAPLLHWRVCHVWDWLTFMAPTHGLPTALVAQVYGGDEAEELNARTGCIGCPLATKDAALDYVLSLGRLGLSRALKRLRPLYAELRLFKHRKQKDGERKKDGSFQCNPSRKGPLTLEARAWALGQVLAVQNEINASAVQFGRPLIDLINAEEEARIRELIALRTYPNKWSDADPDAIELIAQTNHDGSRQELLLTLEPAT